ncbi:ammonium transporter [Reticulomyxa filosa]|uniref:Ammonium transporter n=1 Tax=Reticulomyxa filosa TaxID=46433 RepID=X6ND76_RETFI|nr:ammonium transporter [Reticulomyxa filosa]|eukprot:ETO23911.1 ammonium transporter [Reticulomyxa filosa]
MQIKKSDHTSHNHNKNQQNRLFATTLVMLQTPGMGLTQAGLIREKNALSMLAQTFLGMTIGALLWIICGFGLTFGRSLGDLGLIGDPFEYVFFTNVSIKKPYHQETAPNIPAVLFASFQMMFALMTPLIVSGSWVERMSFKSVVIFLIVWPILKNPKNIVSIFDCVTMNRRGWLCKLGFEDFAGGIVIHASAGVSGLVVSVLLHKRFGREQLGIFF